MIDTVWIRLDEYFTNSFFDIPIQIPGSYTTKDFIFIRGGPFSIPGPFEMKFYCTTIISFN